MKFKINTQRGTVLLVVALLTLTVVVLGILTVKMIKCLKRVDGIVDRRFRDENFTNSLLSLPPGAVPSSVKINTVNVYFESRDIPRDPPAGLGGSQEHEQSSYSVEMRLGTNGVISLSIRNMACDGWTNTALGSYVPLDEYGFPALPYSSGPAFVGVAASLYSKSNLNSPHWDYVMPVTLQTNVSTFYPITLSESTQRFYRVVQP